MENSTQIRVKKVKEFLLGRHVALLGSLLACVATFLEWGIEPITGVSITGLQGGDPQLILILCFFTAGFLYFKKFYKATATLALIALIVSGVQYYEFTFPTVNSDPDVRTQAGIGIYLAIIGSFLATGGSVLQIFKKH